ncbi:UbiA family prenyltransferase [Gilvimarinus sp. DA14]|uniref:UbiA family prenyltransferase n=1 Tax=Gilvimarinus sp. DA14 TaxID=2956798 RepID=UPI0020B70D3B|nr:UbiA family prenyltransferase [Gilvimarinus sp. DA14]UTF59752.1 UbiA family prenyltransferase [Gilvimarinus sp. DA14]
MLKTALALGRVSNLPTVWMNVLAASALTANAFGFALPTGIVFLLALAMSFFYAAGMCLNDYCDRHWDAERQPFRPIPAGKISASKVLSLSLGLFCAGFALLLLAPSARGVIAACGLAALIVAYDFLHKKHWATVLLMALTRLGVYLVAAFALTGSATTAVVVMGLIQCAYTLLVTVVARLENHKSGGYGFPVIPWMIACMGLVDGIALSILLSPWWLLAGIVTLVLTRWGQKYVRGD